MKRAILLLVCLMAAGVAQGQDSYLRKDSGTHSYMCSTNSGPEHACTQEEFSLFWASLPIYYQPFGDPSDWEPHAYFKAMEQWIDYEDSLTGPSVMMAYVNYDAKDDGSPFCYCGAFMGFGDGSGPYVYLRDFQVAAPSDEGVLIPFYLCTWRKHHGKWVCRPERRHHLKHKHGVAQGGVR